MKKICAYLLATLLLLSLAVPCLADEEADGDAAALALDEETEETDTETEATPTPTETPVETTPTPTETPVETTPTPTETPVQETPSSSEQEPSVNSVTLSIDDANIYEGMDIAYKDGYVPRSENGIVTLVLPLLASGALKGDQITVTPTLGDSPIQQKNYQKTFTLAQNPVEDGDSDPDTVKTVEGYLVTFEFPLSDDRENGTYPVTLDVRGTTASGGTVQQTFTCYITVTDGPVDDAGGTSVVTETYVGGGSAVTEEETPESQPKVIVSKCVLSASPVTAGDEFTATVTLQNTSKTQDVQNMTVTVACASSNFVLLNDSDTIFIDGLDAGETMDVEIQYKTDLETPAQRYTVTLAMSYDNSEAVSLSATGGFLVEVAQPLRVELSPVTLDTSVNAGETIQLSYQVMNLGRTEIYNVRVELDVPGLIPSSTAFIGNLEAGTDATATQDVFVGAKDMTDDTDTEDGERYGYTSGTVTLIYEDAAGTEYTEEATVSTTINELVITAADATEEEEAQARAVQWWVFLIIGAVVIAVLAVVVRRTGPKGKRVRK